VSPDLIEAPTVWAAIGADPLNGNFDGLPNIKVGVIDTGIVETHPFIAACRPDGISIQKVFFSGEGTAMLFGETIVFDHGTHVAGTIGGCPTPGSDTNFPIQGTLSGIAPGVTLADYNVFPGFGAGFIAFGGSAFSHDIIAAVEEAVEDGMDVINLSLGGGVAGPHDTLSEAINAAAEAGVVAAVAAGNSGPGDRTVGSPGNAAGALTAGASTNPHFVGIPVTVGTATFGAALGDFDNFGVLSDVSYTVTVPANGCNPLDGDLTGQIALIDRGACTFTTKIRNAQAANAIGVLIVNNQAGDPVGMAHDGTDPFPTIPAAMISRDNGDLIKPSGTVSIDGTTRQEFITQNADIIAKFSSRGPTPFDFLIKPDVTAPGVNVLSSVFEGKYEFFQGTSMATPHVAGAAALLLAANGDWSPEDVKSALVNTADRTVTDFVTGEEDPGVLTRGGGRINLANALNTPATLSPASVSFGLWTGNKPVEASVDVTFTNQRSVTIVCGLSSTGNWLLGLSTTTLTLSSGATATATVTLSGGRTIESGDYEGDVVAVCDDGTSTTTLLAPWWARVERTSGASQGSAAPAFGGLAGVGLSLTATEIAAIAAAWSGITLALVVLTRRRP
jgi:minor extracellular serine protease Vpr